MYIGMIYGHTRDICLPAWTRPVTDAEIFVERDVCLGWYEAGLSMRQAPVSLHVSVYSGPNIRQGPMKIKWTAQGWVWLPTHIS